MRTLRNLLIGAFIITGVLYALKTTTTLSPAEASQAPYNYNTAKELACAPDDMSYAFLSKRRAKIQTKVVKYDLLEETLPEYLTPQAVIDTIDWAVEVWGRVAQVPKFVEAAGAASKVRFAPANEFKDDSWGVTAWRAVGTNLTFKEIRFNKTYPFSIEPRPGKIHFPSAVLHEIGHALGLGHPPKGSRAQVMFDELAPGEIKTKLCLGDIRGIRFLYGNK